MKELIKVPGNDLTGKVAIVTGSTRGIGAAIAMTLAMCGASVVITGRKQEACDKFAAEIIEAGGSALGVATEVTNMEHLPNLVNKTVEAFGRIDILVNNAGFGGKESPILTIDEEEWDMTVDADLKAVFFLSKLVAAQMKEQGYEPGTAPYRIVNMASAAGIKSPKYASVYGAAKAGVIQLTKIMANEWARYGITVNSIAPGYVVTDMTKDVRADEKNVAVVQKMIAMRRFAEVEDVAGVALFLCSEAANYVTGVLIPVDGGMVLN